MKVLVLKAPKETSDEVDPYVAALQNAGLDAEGLEVLSFQYTNQEILQQKALHPKNHGGLVFTSPRGVVALAQCLEGCHFDKHSWCLLPTYVVGEGTAKVLWEKFQMTSIGQESGSAQQLAQYICKDLQGRSTKPLLFPSAELKHNTLQDILSNVGILVDCVTSYKTVPSPTLVTLLKEKLGSITSRPDCLVFFSPSGVNAVLSQIVETGIGLEQFKMVAIGPTTEGALKEQGLTVFTTARNPSPSGLVEALKVALENKNLQSKE